MEVSVLRLRQQESGKSFWRNPVAGLVVVGGAAAAGDGDEVAGEPVPGLGSGAPAVIGMSAPASPRHVLPKVDSSFAAGEGAGHGEVGKDCRRKKKEK